MSIFDLKAEYNRNRIIKEQDTLENEVIALRARLAECERDFTNSVNESNYKIAERDLEISSLKTQLTECEQVAEEMADALELEKLNRAYQKLHGAPHFTSAPTEHEWKHDKLVKTMASTIDALATYEAYKSSHEVKLCKTCDSPVKPNGFCPHCE